MRGGVISFYQKKNGFADIYSIFFYPGWSLPVGGGVTKRKGEVMNKKNKMGWVMSILL